MSTSFLWDPCDYNYDLIGETFLCIETITNICDSMKRLIPIILVLLVIALSGCTGQDVPADPEGQTFDRTNLNLNGKMMDIELLPGDARAGENITANLVVGNTGNENIVSETIEIKARARSLDDFLANLALLAMSEEKKTMTFSIDYNEEIKPGMIKPFSHVFPTLRELKGRNLAGTYDITIVLAVNGQKVESKSLKLKLRSGKPRGASTITSNIPSYTPSITAAATPTPAATASATVTETPAPTPTPTPAAQAVTVDTFIFGWDNVPGTDSARLTGFLKNKFGIDWVETATIEKSTDDMNINLSSGTNLMSIKFTNDEKTKVSLTINDGRTAEFIGVNVDGKKNIYSGKLRYTRIKGWTFSEKDITIDAGDWIQWHNQDDEFEYTLIEMNGKLSNITVRARRFYYLDTTGTYTFQLYYPKIRTPPSPPEQVVTVILNQSQ